jgi:aerobic carbon-monoxide dehydrogenase medium subunit
MKPPRFDYHAPTSVDEVLALLDEHGDEAKVLAGGQSLVPLLSMRLARPSQLIDINDVAGLSGISVDNGHVVFGATTREREAESSADVRNYLPLMAEALPNIGHVSIRNRGTVGGSIAHADASAELPAVATTTGAEMVLISSRGERVLPADEFFQGHFTTAMADDELLTQVRIPRSPAGAGWAFQEVARRHGDFAMVGVAAMVALDANSRIDQARLCFFGVADRAIRAGAVEASLVGAEATTDVFSAAAAEAVVEFEPASDIHGSSEYRRHLARVTARRALEAAAGRAGGRA